MRHLILVTTLAALAGLFLAGPALGAGEQMGGMSQSNHPAAMSGQSQDRMQEHTMVRQLDRNQVREMQRILNSKGFQSGQEDGIIGEQTHMALRQFQQDQNLTQTGEPDPETLRALAPSADQQEFFGLSPSYGEGQEHMQQNMEQHQEMEQHKSMEQNKEMEQKNQGSGY